jgi:hypothetical protein
MNIFGCRLSECGMFKTEKVVELLLSYYAAGKLRICSVLGADSCEDYIVSMVDSV